jgi:hypothetical protein
VILVSLTVVEDFQGRLAHIARRSSSSHDALVSSCGLEGRWPTAHCKSKRTFQLFSCVLTSMPSPVQDIMPRLMQLIWFALFVHAVNGSPPNGSEASHKLLQDTGLGRASGAANKANVLYLFPNGTAKMEKAFLSVYKNFEDTCAL